MKRLPFRKLDAFATPTSGGNPAAAIYLNHIGDLTDAEMLRIARELKGFVSEVGFSAPEGPEVLRLRYFSSEREVAFCGHATIAIVHDLLKREPRGALTIRTIRGDLKVEDRIAREDAVYILAPEPRFFECEVMPEEACAALGCSPGMLDEALPVGLVDAGNRTLCLGFQSLDGVLGLDPELGALQAFCTQHQLDVITVFTAETAREDCCWRTRVFAAPFGYVEDPATGSGNAALGYQLHRAGLWQGEPMVLEQNGLRTAPNLVRLASIPDAVHGLRVKIGGGSVCRIEGEYFLGSTGVASR